MPDPSTDPPALKKLLSILDTLGTEHQIRALLRGGTLHSHLATIPPHSPPLTTKHNRQR